MQSDTCKSQVPKGDCDRRYGQCVMLSRPLAGRQERLMPAQERVGKVGSNAAHSKCKVCRRRKCRSAATVDAETHHRIKNKRQARRRRNRMLQTGQTGEAPPESLPSGQEPGFRRCPRGPPQANEEPISDQRRSKGLKGMYQDEPEGLWSYSMQPPPPC